ncbi:MAG: DUF4105 domain-containing protein [Gemmatimonadaceae bacterium]|nr:DUF4105 domain-containing protein [Gemmatimonadaceae bacterium]MCW5826312.1 DUF4105 domain-containing protein [Gemmatimonadaceae bacterium]
MAMLALHPSSVIRPLSAQSAQASNLRITVLTFGPGDLVFERFGHNALRIVDPARGLDIAYNWGMFDFDQPNFLGRFLSGDTKYWVEAFHTQPLIDFYIAHDRSAVEQELNLTPVQRERLAAAVAEQALEANRYYRYDYFRDNCSTRLRDAVDDVLGGALRRRFEPIRTEWTYRNESIRLTGPTYYSQLGIELALGPRADAPLSAWDAMFIPMRLRDFLREVTIPAPDGGTMPLVINERVLHTPVQRPAEPEVRRGLTLGALGPVLGIWTLMLIPLNAAARRKRRIPAAVMTALFYGLTGLIGSVIALMWVGSAHVFWYGNYTLLLCSPLALVAAVTGTRAVWRGEMSRVALITVGVVTGSALLALLVAPFVAQRMSGPLMFLLPAHLGLAVAIWRHTRPMPEPAP